MITKVIEGLYKDKFSAYEFVSLEDENTFQTSHTEKCVLKDIPCRCSYSSDNAAVKNSDGVYNKAQTVKIITGAKYDIKPGAKIVVTKATGQEVIYKASGQPAFYPSHQEINLELWEEYT